MFLLINSYSMLETQTSFKKFDFANIFQIFKFFHPKLKLIFFYYCNSNFYFKNITEPLSNIKNFFFFLINFDLEFQILGFSYLHHS